MRAAERRSERMKRQRWKGKEQVMNRNTERERVSDVQGGEKKIKSTNS